MQSTKSVSKRLFIGSLPYRFTEGELLTLFITEGKIVSIRVMHNRWGKSRGMAYVEYENLEDAIHAKEKYHNYYLGDRTIIVDYAEPDPFLTDEGQARHEEALQKHPNRRQAQVYLPHPDSDSNEYKERRSMAHSGLPFRPSSPKIIKTKTYKGGKPVFNSLGRSLNRNTTGEPTPVFISEVSQSKKKFRPKPGQKPEYKSSSPSHVRTTVFKQRKFGSKVGAKFAFKSKKTR
jgi:RNA recognition motif-containing protein